MSVLLISFKPNDLCAASTNLCRACTDVLIIGGNVQKALGLTGLCKVKRREKLV